MNRIKAHILAVMAVVLLTGCASYRQRYAEVDREFDAKYDPARYRKKHAPADREKYLAAHPDRPEHVKEALRLGVWAVGMTEEELRLSIVRPDYVNRSVSASEVSEQWVWRAPSGNTIYFYLRNGVLDSYQKAERIRPPYSTSLRY